MAAAPQITASRVTLDDYLTSSYHPDCDFVDGSLEARSMGGAKHGLLQMQLGYWFISHQKEWRIRVMSELRTRVSETRVRLPDVCVVPSDGALSEDVRVTPPLLAIEILSPDDRMTRVIERLEDFLNMGVQNVWLLDPEARAAYIFAHAGLKLVRASELRLSDSPIYINLDEIFLRSIEPG